MDWGRKMGRVILSSDSRTTNREPLSRIVVAGLVEFTATRGETGRAQRMVRIGWWVGLAQHHMGESLSP